MALKHSLEWLDLRTVMSLHRLPEESPTLLNVNLEELIKVCRRSTSTSDYNHFSKLTLPIAGHRKGRSLLIEDAVLEWLISNSNIASTSTRRHIELALCHLAQNGKHHIYIYIFFFSITKHIFHIRLRVLMFIRLHGYWIIHLS